MEVNCRYWRSVYARLSSSASSDTAKWVKIPSASSPGRAHTRRMASKDASKLPPSQGKPSRDMPVSSLMCIFNVPPALCASREKARAALSLHTA